MQLYNSMTNQKETFVPLREGKVGMYVCGPTVYNYFHIGNARPFVTFDVLRRYFEHIGYEVTYVQNFTDIDDRMITKANEEGITVGELAQRFIQAYREDAEALGVRPATIHPRATEHIERIIAMIERLIENGLAYELDGDVYYHVKAFPAYGALCGQNIEDLESGARVSVDEHKKDPLDFALWKKQKPGEPAWDSPWGKGRPGWHIECSAMSTAYLGDTFDIHGGGKDLLFPHHENEIAQTTGATGKPYVRYWLHNGFINIDNEKMSKSKNNFFTVRDIAKEYDLEAVRMFLLSAHYRSPVNFSRDQIMQAQSSLQRLYNARDQLKHLKRGEACEKDAEFVYEVDKAVERFEEAMSDDLNTADALGALFELARAIFALKDGDISEDAASKAQKAMDMMTDVLGLLRKKPDDALPSDIQDMVDRRAQARKDKDWKKSDELRDSIKAAGYILEDTPTGQKVRKGV